MSTQNCQDEALGSQEDPHLLDFVHEFGHPIAVRLIAGVLFFVISCLIPFMTSSEHIIDMLWEVNWTIAPRFVGNRFRFGFTFRSPSD